MIKKIFTFYIEGFKSIDYASKKLWLIIFIKLFIMFAILKLIFFPNFLNSKFDTDQEKSDYVIETITN